MTSEPSDLEAAECPQSEWLSHESLWQPEGLASEPRVWGEVSRAIPSGNSSIVAPDGYLPPKSLWQPGGLALEPPRWGEVSRPSWKSSMFAPARPTECPPQDQYLSPKSLWQPANRAVARPVLREGPTALPSGNSGIFAPVRPTECPPQGRYSSQKSLWQSYAYVAKKPHDLKGSVTILKRTTPLDPVNDPVEAKDVWEGIWTAPNNEAIPVFIRPLGSDVFDADDDPKVPLERMERCLKREETIWEAVTHDNIVPLLGYLKAVDKSPPQFVYPLFKNGTLRSYISNRPWPLTYIERLQLALSLVRSLGNLHSREPAIVHGNLKPANVMVNDDMQCVLLDFGNSRVIAASDTHSDFDIESTTGTVVYLAKELLQENALPTLASDVYALGGLILFIMSGKAPFHQISGGAVPIILAIIRGETPLPSDHPALAPDDSLWGLMKQCWDPHPDGRPSTRQIIYKINLILTCGSGLTGPIHSDTLDTLVESVVQPAVPITFIPPRASWHTH